MLLQSGLPLLYKASMRTATRVLAVVQAALIGPAVVFLTAVLIGVGAPPQYELAHRVQRFVAWFSGKRWTLQVLLILLPFAALMAGASMLLQMWNREPEVSPSSAPIATLFVGWATLTSAGILTVVALHMLAN